MAAQRRRRAQGSIGNNEGGVTGGMRRRMEEVKPRDTLELQFFISQSADDLIRRSGTVDQNPRMI